MTSYGTTVIVQHVTGETDNDDGTTSVTTSTATVAGCVVYPVMTVEATQGQDVVNTELTLLAPFGTVIAADDSVSVLGHTYQVTGDPFPWQSPLTGTARYVQATLRRVH